MLKTEFDRLFYGWSAAKQVTIHVGIEKQVLNWESGWVLTSEFTSQNYAMKLADLDTAETRMTCTKCIVVQRASCSCIHQLSITFPCLTGNFLCCSCSCTWVCRHIGELWNYPWLSCQSNMWGYWCSSPDFPVVQRELFAVLFWESPRYN